MVFSQRPLLIMSTGLRPPDILAAALTFAQQADCIPRILLRVPQRSDNALLAKYADVLRETLPSEFRELPIETVRSKNMAARLDEIAQTEGGIVALQPTRRRVFRALMRNDFERLFIDGPLPVLTVPTHSKPGSMKRVLFPADFSSRSLPAFETTIALCQQLGAELDLLHVFGPDRLLASEFDQERRNAAQSPEELYALDKESLAELAQHSSQAGIPTRTATAEGRAHERIVAHAATNAIDLIVLATHGPRSSEDIVRGTTSARVVLGTQTPVLTIQS